MENNTQARNREAHLLTYLTPIKTTAISKTNKMEPYTLMLFSITEDCAPPPDLTSPKRDIDGAIYVYREK